MLECKDCCLYNTDACRYGRYALEHNMSLNCDDFIVEHNKAYQQGRADERKKILDILKTFTEGDYNSKECKLLLADLCEMLLEQSKEQN